MIKTIELFGGVSAFRKGAQKANISLETVDYVEWNKEATESYNALYGENFKPMSVVDYDKVVGGVELLTHGSPCTSFSLAGKQEGGEKGSGTQSSLLWESVRIIRANMPPIVIWENVENAIKGKHRNVFDEYLEEMKDMGYSNSWKVLNGVNYGIPQARKRVFVVSVLGGKEFVFPNNTSIANNLEEYLDFRDKDDLTFNFYNRYKEIKDANATEEEFLEYIDSLRVSTRGIGTMKMDLYTFGEMDTITTASNYTGTLTCRNVQNYNKKYWYDKKLYKPSPRMCWRLMGFDDSDFDKVKDLHSDKFLYNQAGNSIIVDVVQAIFEELVNQGFIEAHEVK